MSANATSALGTANDLAPSCLRTLRGWLHRKAQRKLRLCETLNLGDKRFVAVVQFEQMRYLVGGAGASIALLSKLPDCPGETLAGLGLEREPACED